MRFVSEGDKLASWCELFGFVAFLLVLMTGGAFLLSNFYKLWTLTCH